MAMRCKMTLHAVVGNTWGTGVKAFFHTQYDPSIAEDVAFTKATPTGHIEMVVDNPAAIKQLVEGQAYYVDFSPVGTDAAG